jgi:hypothetical protein
MTTHFFATGATVATPGALELGELLSETVNHAKIQSDKQNHARGS